MIERERLSWSLQVNGALLFLLETAAALSRLFTSLLAHLGRGDLELFHLARFDVDSFVEVAQILERPGTKDARFTEIIRD